MRPALSTCLAKPIALVVSVSEQLLHHANHVIVRVFLVVPKDHVIAGLTLRTIRHLLPLLLHHDFVAGSTTAVLDIGYPTPVGNRRADDGRPTTGVGLLQHQNIPHVLRANVRHYIYGRTTRGSGAVGFRASAPKNRGEQKGAAVCFVN